MARSERLRGAFLKLLLVMSPAVGCSAPAPFETTVSVEPVVGGWSGADIRVLGTRPAGSDMATDFRAHLVLRVGPDSSHELNATATGGVMRVDEPGAEGLQPGVTLDATSIARFMVDAGVTPDSPSLPREAEGLLLVLETAGMGPKIGVQSNDAIRILAHDSRYR